MGKTILVLILISISAWGQVVVNGGRTFLGPVDATNATRTQPFRMGAAASRPAVCVQGEVYFQTDAVAGQNLQFCTASNVWTAMTGGTIAGGGNVINTGVPAVSAIPRYSSTTGTDIVPSAATVDGSGNMAVPGVITTGGASSGSVMLSGSTSGSASITVAAAAGTPADLVLPKNTGTNGQALVTDGGTPQQLSWATISGGGGNVSTTSANAYTAGMKQTFASSATTAGMRVAAAVLPSVPVAGDLAVDSAASNVLKYYDGSAWQTAGGAGGGGNVSTTAANAYTAGMKQTFASSATTAGMRVAAAVLPSVPVAGDLAVDSAASNVLKYYDGSAWQTAGGAGGGGNVSTTTANSYTAGMKQTFASSATTAGMRVTAAVLPSVPVTGDLAVDSAASNVLKYYDGSAWHTAGGAGGGGDVSTTSANSYTAGMKQTFASSATTAGMRVTAAVLPSVPVTGDLAVDSAASNVLKYYDGSAWQTAGGGGGGGNVSTTSANSYTAGMKQTFASSATTAGMRVTAAVLPSVPVTGDLAVDSAASNVLKYYDGSAWQTAGGGGGGGNVSTTSANSYTAGMKQTFASSATTAGMRVTAAVLPSVPVTGDLAVDSAASNVLKYYDGSAWQTAGGGGGGISAADIPTNYGTWFWPFGFPQAASANGVQSSLRTYFAVFVLPVRMSVGKFGFRVQTAAGNAAAGLSMGIYSSNADGSCNALVLSGNKSSGLNTAGYYTITTPATTLTPGSYYFAWSTDDTAMNLSGSGQGSMMASFGALPNGGSAGSLFFYGTASTGSGASITLPATCGSRNTPSSIGIPHVVLLP